MIEKKREKGFPGRIYSNPDMARFGRRNTVPLSKKSQCSDCVHRLRPGTCQAFPEGIPQRIFLNEISHRSPYPGDHGLQYERET